MADSALGSWRLEQPAESRSESPIIHTRGAPGQPTLDNLDKYHIQRSDRLSMSQDILQQHEIQDSVAALREGFTAIRQIRNSRSQGRLVQFPKIPSILSESVVAQEILAGRGVRLKGPVLVRRGGTKADLVVKSKGKELRVEVKGTGKQGFGALGPKDVNADVLVWIAYGAFFEGDSDTPITAHWLHTPRRVVRGGKIPSRISLGEFITRSGRSLKSETLTNPVFLPRRGRN